MQFKNFKRGLIHGVPIALGYLAVSISFGVSAVNMGLTVLEALFISMANLTSAGQLAGIEIIATATATTFLSALFQIILTQLVINARYFLMSLSLSQKLEDGFSFRSRLLCAFGVTDEIFGVAIAQKDVLCKKYLLGLIVLPFVGWSSGTICGALAGNVLPSFIADALGIALYAMFIAIIIPASLSDKKVFPVILIAVALSCLFFFVPVLNSIPTGLSYIICALIASIIGAIFFPIKEEENNG